MLFKVFVVLTVVALMGAISIGPARARLGSSGVVRASGVAVAHVSGFRGGPPRDRALVGRPYGQFVPPFAPISLFYSYGPSYPSCWTWLPAPSGWRRVYVCNWPYVAGYDYY
jgi:hypothetical protein